MAVIASASRPDHGCALWGCSGKGAGAGQHATECACGQLNEASPISAWGHERLFFTSWHIHGKNAGASVNVAASAGDDALHWFAGLWAFRYGSVRHSLLDFKPARFLSGLFGDGFVGVGGHE